MSTNPAIIRRNVLRKVKRGIDRLPSQGPDPAETARTPNGWRIAAAAVLERYPTVMPEPHDFESKYLRGRFIWESSVSRPGAEELFKSERDGLAGTLHHVLSIFIRPGSRRVSLLTVQPICAALLLVKPLSRRCREQ